MMNQTCRKCLVEKPIGDYQFHRVSGKHYQTCRRCRQLQSYEWNKNNRDKKNAADKKWRDANPEKLWWKRNPEEHRARTAIATAKWWVKNPEYSHQHYLKNKTQFVAARARRRAKQANATPIWLTPIHKAQIQEMYDVAAARETQTGVKYHVDHIIPITGKKVSGMHVPWNLQVITATENLSKGWRI
jgi:hypothetical protein